VVAEAGFGVSSEIQTDEMSDVASQLRTMRQLIARLASLNVDPTEYACLKAIVLFKPGNLVIGLSGVARISKLGAHR